MCDNPNCQHGETFFQDQNRNIEEHGFSILCVFGDEEAPGFVYTVGLSEKGLADLIFIGDSSPNAAAYLQGAALSQLQGHDLPMGRIEPLWSKADSEEEIAQKLEAIENPVNGFPVPMMIIDAEDRLKTHAYSALRRLEAISSDNQARLVQVVMPDMQGRFPWEPGYDWLDQDVKAAPAGTHGV